LNLRRRPALNRPRPRARFMPRSKLGSEDGHTESFYYTDLTDVTAG
jgi:hypothetical protein